jgi:hypothetical protein
VDRKKLYRWMNGEVSPRLDEIERFAEVIGPVSLHLGTKKEAPAPEWAEALASQVAERTITLLVPPEILGAAHRLLAQLAELPRQGGATGDEVPVELDRAE